MNEDQKARILENSLERLLAGEPLERILADTPHEGFDTFEAELIEVSEATRFATVLTAPSIVPAPGQPASKAGFLAAAAEQRKALRWERWAWLLKPSRLAPVIAIFVAAVVWTGFASAQALPGDSLYPVKLAAQRTRILMTMDPVEKVVLEMRYNEERLSEFELVAEHDRDSEITFSGFVKPGPDGSWYIEYIRLEFPAGMAVEDSLFDGAYVLVHGVPAGPDQLLVEDIQLRVETLTGEVEAVGEQNLRVNRREVVITASTRMDGNVTVGSQVEIVAARIERSLLEAITIRVISVAPGSGPLPDEVFEHQGRTITAKPHDEEIKETETPEVETKEVIKPAETSEREQTQETKTYEPDSEPENTPEPEPAETPKN